VTTMAFDISLLELFGPLAAGGRVVVVPRELVVDGERLAQMLAAEKATIMQATPTTWRLLVESGWRGRSGFKGLVGGEALSPPLMAALVSRCAELWNMYGPTEATVWSTCHHCRAGESQVLIGRPIANTAVYILDAAQQPLPPGVWGELYLGGLGVASGYLNQPELTAERFVADPFGAAPGGVMYRTGDICRFRHNGAIEYGGRTDSQVKVRGFRIELGEIDCALLRYPGITAAATITATDPGGETVLVSYLTGAAAEPVGDILDFLRGIIPAFMVPSHIVALPRLPLTPNGKIDRGALPPPWSAAVTPAARQRPAEADNDIERSLLTIWREVLGRDALGTKDNFFDVGGTSIKILQVKTLVAKRLGAELAAAELFQFPTVAALAARIGVQDGRTRKEGPELAATRITHRNQALAQRRNAARRARVAG
jgi:acyl-coenzyme A synthetase/AMP-(fatty) acid ligase/acyl carrier protein